MTKSEALARLNSLRAQNGKGPITSWSGNTLSIVRLCVDELLELNRR